MQINWLQAMELTTFVVSDLTERVGDAVHPEAGFKLAGLMYDTVQFLAGQDLDFPIMVEVLVDRLAELAGDNWDVDKDPFANWVPDPDSGDLPDWCSDYKRGLRED